jgi:hypothetical protein
LDQKVGRGKHVVALSGDRGVAPIPADIKRTGFDAGVLRTRDLQASLEKALAPFHFAQPLIAKVAGNEVYFSKSIYQQLRDDPAALQALLHAARSTPGVAQVFRAEELGNGVKTTWSERNAAQLSFRSAQW